MASDAKRIKVDVAPYLAIEACSKQIIELKQAFNQRMTTMESRFTSIASCCNTVAVRLDSLETLLKTSMATGGTCNTVHRHPCCEEVLKYMKNFKQDMLNTLGSLGYGDGSAVENALAAPPPVVIVHNQCPSLNAPTQVSANVSLDSKMQVITLNGETDYPDGSWLGDENNAECRVRVPISPLDLLHINSFCHTPEKMALMLLDYLFPREVLAVSNLSGKGKHGKKQLSPLMIYGIRCHLVHRFSIMERDWYRIKQNMDSKCRTAWRKKLKGLPLGGFKHTVDNEDEDQTGNPTLHSVIVTASGHLGSDDSVDGIDAESVQLIHTPQGDIKVVHATPNQLARIQETHSIQVLNEDQLLPGVLQENTSILSNDTNSELGVSDSDPLSSLGEHQTLTLVTSTGEVVSLSAGAGLSLGEEVTRNIEEDE